MREPCLGFDLARPCPPVASLRLCALGTSSRLHRRITALSPSRDHPWPNSGAPSLHFLAFGCGPLLNLPCAQLLYRTNAATFADVHCCYLSAGPIVVFPFRAPRLARLAWPRASHIQSNQSSLQIPPARPRSPLSLNFASAAAHLRRPPFPPDAVATLIDWHLSHLSAQHRPPASSSSAISIVTAISLISFPSTPRAFLDHHHLLTLSAAIAIDELHHHRPTIPTRGRDPFQHGFILVGRFHLRIATDDLFRSTSFPCLLTHVGPAD